jgi:hypothetical protein
MVIAIPKKTATATMFFELPAYESVIFRAKASL